MSASAGIARGFGYDLAGSDSKEIYHPARAVLDREKIAYFIGYDEKNIKKSKAGIYIISAGEDLNNPEVKFIYDNHLPHYSFSELLYELAKDNLRIVVTGTHGKSTTAGLIGHIVKNLDDSSFMVGAVLQNYQSNFYKGKGHYFVFEGDEYKAEFDDPTPKFHYYKPDILVLTNLEFDHPDIFESLEALEREFNQLIEALPEDGLIVYNADDANISKLAHRSTAASVSFGIENEADIKAENIKYDSQYTTIEVKSKHASNISAKVSGQTESYKIRLPGKMNVYNALGAIALFRTLGFGQEQIALDLLSYQGVKRRFELVSVKNGIIIIDDYAHHPTAVKETLDAARLRYFPPTSNIQSPTSKLWAVFEPHTFSRTKATLPELAKAFDAADEVLISDIYPAREKASGANITSAEIIEAVGNHNSKFQIHNSIRLVKNKSKAMDILKTELKPSDAVIIMAVGNFNRLAYELKDVL